MRTFTSRLFDYIEETDEYCVEASTLTHGGAHPEIFRYDIDCNMCFFFELRGKIPIKFVVQDVDKQGEEIIGWRLIPAPEVRNPPTFTIYVLND